MTSPRIITGPDEINAFLQKYKDINPDITQQLGDFDFESIVVFPNDIRLKKGEHMFTSDWISAATQGVIESANRQTLIVVEGNIVSQEAVSLSEDCAIFLGNVECPQLYVDGESFLLCKGTCTANLIESSYNGVRSLIEKAETGFFFVGEWLLEIGELNTRAMQIDQFAGADWEVLEMTFLDGMMNEDDGITRECKEKIAAGEPVLRWDCHEIMHQIARLSENPDAAVKALAAIKDIDKFRFWQSEIAKKTVLHAMTELDRPHDEIQGWIQTLLAAGVPADV